jgi:hypothetical protein
MKQKTPEIGAQARAQIAQNLPSAMEKAINAYHNFIDDDDDKKSTRFKNKHTAAKAALAHIELLIKLGRMVDAMDDDTQDHLEILIAEAKKELGKNKK